MPKAPLSHNFLLFLVHQDLLDPLEHLEHLDYLEHLEHLAPPKTPNPSTKKSHPKVTLLLYSYFNIEIPMSMR